MTDTRGTARNRRRAALALLCLAAGIALGCQGSALTGAKLYLKQGDPEKAKEQLMLALESEPEHPEVHFLLGRIYGDRGEYANMSESFNRSLELSEDFRPQIEQFRRQYWTRLYNDGVERATGESPDFSAAAASFKLATTVDPEPLDAWRNLAYSHYRLRDLDGAVQAYEFVAARAPEDSSTFQSLGMLYLERGDLTSAERTFEQLLESNPRHLGALNSLASIYMDNERYGDAEAAFGRALEAAPDVWQTHFNLGNLYWKQDRFDSARDAYFRALELNPADIDTRFNLAVTYLALESTDEALPHLEELSRRTPDNATVWRELGRVYALQERIKESKAAYDTAAALEE